MYYTNAAPKKSFRPQENDTFSSSNPLSFISPLDTELQHKTESAHRRGNTDSYQEEKHYEKPEPFDFTNYIQATAPSSPTLYHDNNKLNHSSEIPFTFGSTSDDPTSRKDPVATPFPTPVTKPKSKPLDSSEPHTSHTIQKYQTKSTIPFVSMDHDRRKRRRMTMEDAFANCLTMNQRMDSGVQSSSSSSVDWIMTPERDVCTTPTATTPTEPSITTSPMDPGYDYNTQEHFNMGYSNISKKLEFSEGMPHEGGPSMLPNMDTNAMRRQTSQCSSNEDLNPEVDDDLTMNDDTNTETSTSSTTSSSNHSNGLSLLFAPRKHKGQNAKFRDPVDERIEELIRHSRIKAMMMTNREKKRDVQQRGQRYKTGAVHSFVEDKDDMVVNALFGQKRKNTEMENHQTCGIGTIQDDSYSDRLYNDGQRHKPHPLTGKVLSFDLNPICETKTTNDWNTISSPSKTPHTSSFWGSKDTVDTAGIIHTRFRSNSIPSAMKFSNVEEESLEME